MPTTILLVEDSDDDVFFITRAFKAAGVVTPITRVGNGQEAIDYLGGQRHYADRIQFPIPSLVLLDFKMPFVSGIEVLRWIRAHPHLAHLPAVIFTTSSQESDVRRAYAAGANAYLIKPPSLEEGIRLAVAFKQFWIDSNVPPSIDPSLLMPDQVEAPASRMQAPEQRQAS